MKKVTIMQLDMSKSAEVRYKMFASIRLLRRMGLQIKVNEYQKVWSGEMDVEDAEDVYRALQGEKPAGYKGHSLSVSDIVMIDEKVLYCDDYGFVDMAKTKVA